MRSEHAVPPRTSTGVAGLDRVLEGGLPVGHAYLLAGAPGTGKTTLALQFLLAGRGEGGRDLLYITLSQTEAELRQIAASHGFNLDEVTIVERLAVEVAVGAAQTVLTTAEEELDNLIQAIEDAVVAHEPSRLVIDSLSEIRLVSTSLLRYRRSLLGLKNHLASRDVTSLLIDGLDDPEATRTAEVLAHGAMRLDWTAPDYGVAHRRALVTKMRGTGFSEGFHDLGIRTGGVEVHPRLVPERASSGDAQPWELVSGVSALDELFDGALPGNGTTLIVGNTGTGKSVLCTAFAHASARRGYGAALFLFEELAADFVARARALDLDLEDDSLAGAVVVRHRDPAEASPGELFSMVATEVDRGARLIVIDSLTGFLHALPSGPAVMAQFTTLLSYLKERRVATLFTLNMHGLSHRHGSVDVDVSFVADNIVLLRQFEAGAQHRRTISVTKKRYGPHRREIRALEITLGGVQVSAIADSSEMTGQRPLNLPRE